MFVDESSVCWYVAAWNSMDTDYLIYEAIQRKPASPSYAYRSTSKLSNIQVVETITESNEHLGADKEG